MLPNRAVDVILRLTLFISTLEVFADAVVRPGPEHPPTKGEVWPKPQLQAYDQSYYSFDPSQFEVKITGQNCSLLTKAKERYVYVFKVFNKLVQKHSQLGNPKQSTGDNYYQGLVQELHIDLTAPCEEYPHFEMDESCTYLSVKLGSTRRSEVSKALTDNPAEMGLPNPSTISTNTIDNLTVSARSELKSGSIWGIIRGLETFAQLFYLTDDYKEVRINVTQISDFPRYPHRGLLLDTSRHYVSMTNILLTLDAMAMNKMNVFHWHIVDDQSFPYQSERFPDLSAKGAFHPSMVYTKSNIETVVEYARERGIRVVPEFDVPGHTRSWGEAYPNILTECYSVDGQVIGLGPMDPTNNITYKLLRDLFKEVQQWFPDTYFHVGGDEVELSCWESNPQIRAYMVRNNITNASELHALFMRNAIPLLASRSQPIVWQEVFDEGVPLSIDTLVQVWKENWSTYEMIQVLTAGHRVLFSSSWYLDHLGDTFKDYYMVDPRQMVLDATGNQTMAQNVVGGEACMWGEMIDDRNFLPRIWPRASAVAERLWSSSLGIHRARYNIRVPEEALCRVEEHVCRMIRRGIPAQPASGPGFCLA